MRRPGCPEGYTQADFDHPGKVKNRGYLTGALRSQQQQEENNMNRIVIRQAVVVSILGVLLCIALLLSGLLLLASIAGAHHSQTGIMLIASPYHLA
jgi:hypothetical protein